MKSRRLLRILSLLLTFALFAAACGSDDEAATTPEDTPAEVDAGDDEPAPEPEAEEPEAAPAEDVDASGTQAEGDVDTAVEADANAKPSGGEIAIGLEAELVGMRPWEDTCASACYNVLPTIYDKLMESTADGTYEGWLYTDISSNEDFTQWVATLRDGVTFHNGKALDAQNIVDMFAVQLTGATARGDLGSAKVCKPAEGETPAECDVDGVVASGPMEVTYNLTAANSAFPAYLSRAPIGMVFDGALALEDVDAYNENPIGTGPFTFVSRDLDNETIVERNPDYWMSDAEGTQLPYLDRISFRPIPDEGTRLDAVLSGTTQVAHTLRQGTIRDARAARDGGADIFLFEFQGNNVGGGMFNVLVPPFDDVRVRRGLTQMNSQENVIEALGGTGISLPGTQWFSPDSVWYSEKAAAAWPKFDFAAGQALLQEYVDDPERSDGKAVGEPIEAELSCPPDPTLIAAMQVLEQTWSASGLVDLNLTNYDQQTHIDYALGADNGFVGSHTTHCWRVASDDDPSTFLNSALAPPTAEIAEAAGIPGAVSPLNWSNYFNGDVFANLAAAIKTDDFDERYALYEAVMLQLAEDVPIWFSGHTATALIVRSDLMGLNSWVLPNGSLGVGHPAAEGRWGQAFLSGG